MEEKDNTLHKINQLKALDADMKTLRSIDVSEGYRQTQKKIRKQTNRLFMMQTYYKAAAVLAIPLLISTFILSYFLWDNRSEAPVSAPLVELTAAMGTVIKAELPDKSQVWLNSGSTLKYPTAFADNKRVVELEGEAFFEVETSPEHLFEVVTSSGMKVVAKGTSFNVNAYPDEAIHETALRQGVVDVVPNGESISLQPGEMLSYNKETGEYGKTAVNIDEKTGWKDGLLIFRNTPLDEVFKRLSRHFNVDIVVHNETKVEYGIRATFTNQTIIQILDVLKMAAPMTWSVRDMEQNDDLTYTRQQIDVWIK